MKRSLSLLLAVLLTLSLGAFAWAEDPAAEPDPTPPTPMVDAEPPADTSKTCTAESPLASVTLDFKDGAVALKGNTAKQGDVTYFANKFILKNSIMTLSFPPVLPVFSTEALTVPLEITCDATTGANPIISSSTVKLAEGIYLDTPYITAQTDKGNETLIPVRFSGLEAGKVCALDVMELVVKTSTTRRNPVNIKTDSRGQATFWVLESTALKVVLAEGSTVRFADAVAFDPLLKGGAYASTPATALQSVTFAGGDGSAGNPYQINNAAQFPAVAAQPHMSYKLTARDLTVTAPLAQDFSGTFDGNNQPLRLSISTSTGDAGLFLQNSGMVQNLLLSGTVNAQASGAIAGAVAGKNTGTVQRVQSSVAVSGAVAGGIAGRNEGNVNDCATTGNVTGWQTAGGIVGEMLAGDVHTCYATGAVQATASRGAAGGIAGYHQGGTVASSIALNSSVSAPSGTANRVIGQMDARVRMLPYNQLYAAETLTVPSGGTSAPTSPSGSTLTKAQLANASTFRSLGFDTSGGWNVSNGTLPGQASQTVAMPGNLVYRPTSGNGGSGGGSNNEPPYEETFWEDFKSDLRKAKDGTTLRISTAKLPNMPASVLRALEGRDVTLSISYGREKIIINGEEMYDIPRNKLFYTWDDLAELYETPPASSSSVPVSKPLPPASSTAPVTPPSGGNTTASSSAPSSSSQPSSSEVSSSEPEEDEEEPAPDREPEEEPVVKPEAPKRSMIPLVVAGIVILLVIGAAGTAFWYWRSHREDYADEDEDDLPPPPTM